MVIFLRLDGLRTYDIITNMENIEYFKKYQTINGVFDEMKCDEDVRKHYDSFMSAFQNINSSEMTLKDELVAYGKAAEDSEKILKDEKGLAAKAEAVFMKEGTYPRIKA